MKNQNVIKSKSKSNRSGLKNQKFIQVKINFPSEGIDKTLIDEKDIKILSVFECPVSLNLVWEPVECLNCQNVFCEACAQKIVDKGNNKCPMCNKFPFVFRRSLIARKALSLIHLKCINEKCNITSGYSDYLDHLKKCPFVNYKCTNEGCNFIGIKTEIEKHISNCPYRIIICNSCYKETIFNKKDIHIKEECEETDIVCPLCFMKMKRKIYNETHKSENNDNISCLKQQINLWKYKSIYYEEIIKNKDAIVKEKDNNYNKLIKEKDNKYNKMIKEKNIEYNEIKNKLINKKRKNDELERILDNLKKELNVKKNESAEAINVNTIKIIYTVDRTYKTIQLFGSDFVENNKNCKIIINQKEYKICETIEYKKYFGINNVDSIIEIYLCDINKIFNMSYMFCNCNSLKSIHDISKWNNKNITNMEFMFCNCTSLVSLPDISKWDTKNVTSIKFMFCNCTSLISIPDISKWDTKNVNDMSSMLNNCSSLQSLPDISKWNTKNVTDMSSMFDSCNSLKSIPDISKWDTKNVINMNCMFYSCTSLTSIPDISKWDINNSLIWV